MTFPAHKKNTQTKKYKYKLNSEPTAEATTSYVFFLFFFPNTTVGHGVVYFSISTVRLGSWILDEWCKASGYVWADSSSIAQDNKKTSQTGSISKMSGLWSGLTQISGINNKKPEKRKFQLMSTSSSPFTWTVPGVTERCIMRRLQKLLDNSRGTLWHLRTEIQAK